MFRCLGFARGMGSRCGEGYDPAVAPCDTCKHGFFESDGFCYSCDSAAPSFGDIAIRLGFLAGIVVGSGALLFVVIACTLRRATSITKATANLMSRSLTLDFVAWIITLIQLLVQAARASSPGLPPWFRTLVSLLQVFQLDFDGLFPPQCDDGGTEGRVLGVTGIWLCTSLACWVCFQCTCCSGRCWSGLRYWLLHGAVLLSIAVYPLGSKAAIEALACEPVNGQLVWMADRYQGCFSASRVPTLGIAGLGLLLGVIGFPVFLLFASRKHRQGLGSLGALPTAAKPAGSGGSKGEAQRLPGTKQSCCFRRYTVTDDTLEELIRLKGAWTSVYRYGQPWLRPFLFMELALLALFSQVASSASTSARVVALGGTIAVVLVVGAITYVLNPEHQWSQWRRLPRVLMDVAIVLLCAAQISLSADEYTFDPIKATVQSGGDGSGPDTIASLRSEVIIWGLITYLCLLPFLLVLLFLRWLCRFARPGNAKEKARLCHAWNIPIDETLRQETLKELEALRAADATGIELMPTEDLKPQDSTVASLTKDTAMEAADPGTAWHMNPIAGMPRRPRPARRRSSAETKLSQRRPSTRRSSRRSSKRVSVAASVPMNFPTLSRASHVWQYNSLWHALQRDQASDVPISNEGQGSNDGTSGGGSASEQQEAPQADHSHHIEVASEDPTSDDGGSAGFASSMPYRFTRKNRRGEHASQSPRRSRFIARQRRLSQVLRQQLRGKKKQHIAVPYLKATVASTKSK